MARMRKTKLTMQMVETAIELKKAGMYDKYIIAALGVNPSTFYRWMATGKPHVRAPRNAHYAMG